MSKESFTESFNKIIILDDTNEMIWKQKPWINNRVLDTPDLELVGVAGFEPAASCSQSRRDNRATLHPEWILVLPKIYQGGSKYSKMPQ